MKPGMPKDPAERLKKLGIRSFEVLIHDQPKEWLLENFHEGATDYPVNVSALMKNIIWQTRERILSGDKPLLKELVRTFWYMYIKPTLARVESLTHETDQYRQLVDTLVLLVKDAQLMDYKDIGFRDDNQANRKVGLNANVILYAEKVGHQDFLAEMAAKYQVSTIAMGGQPSVMNVEYFVDDLKAQGVDITRSFFLFGIVDYDTSGWIIRDTFVDDLARYGINHVKNTDLIYPDMLTAQEIQMARYPIADTEKGSAKKNTDWLRLIAKRGYKNQKYLATERGPRGQRIIWGLEAQSVSTLRIAEKLDRLLTGLLSKTEGELSIRMLEKILQQLKDLQTIR